MINVKAVRKLMGQEKWEIFIKGSDAIACKCDNTMMFRLSAQEAIELKAGKITVTVDEEQYDKKDRIFEQIIMNFQEGHEVRHTGVLVDTDDGRFIRLIENNKKIRTIDNDRYKISLFVCHRFMQAGFGPLVGFNTRDMAVCLIAPIETDVKDEILQVAALIPAEGEHNE